jgi:hypothetical protein
MVAALHIASLALLGVLIASDFRRREIGVLPLVLSAVANGIIGWLQCGWPELGFQMALNLIFLGLLYLALCFYVGVIRRRVYGSLFRAIGAGDLLFLPALAPLFELREFVLFLTVAFALSLVGWLAYRSASRRQVTIPLVGTVGICWVIYSLFRMRL